MLCVRFGEQRLVLHLKGVLIVPFFRTETSNAD